MATVYVQRRHTTTGQARYRVRYRRGGRGYPLQDAGTFTSLKAARARASLVEELIAAGLDPAREIARQASMQPVTLGMLADQWLTRRRAVGPATMRGYRERLPRLLDSFPGHPEDITPADVNDWIGRLSRQLAPGTVALHVTMLRMILDDLPVNPARDRTVELPRQVRAEPAPPDADDFLAAVRQLTRRFRPTMVVLEQTGMRVSEALAVQPGDVDPSGRLRLRAATTKTGRARWVELPDWIVEMVDWPLGSTRHAVRNALVAGCEQAGVRRFSPHDLRHRRASLWHQQGVVAAELARRLGHARPSMSLDRYAHVMPLREAPVEELVRLLR